MTRNPFIRKLHELRYHYGKAAAEYFRDNPACADCGEDRIACLTVHHLHGKTVDVFATLCFNCHMLEHSASPSFTHADHARHEADRDQASRSRSDRADRIRQFKADGLSLRAIAAKVGISHVRVSQILEAG